MPLLAHACLPQVVDSTSGAIGDPVRFFVLRPDANDASESLGRFPTVGLLAIFQRDRQTFPKGGRDSLTVVPGARASTPTEDASSKSPANGKTVNKTKGKSTAQPLGDESAETRWQTIRGELQSNRCLIMGAGTNVSLVTPSLFESETHSGKGGMPSSAGEEEVETRESELHRQGNKIEGVPPQEGSSAVLPQQTDMPDRERVVIKRSSSFTVCIDFRLEPDVIALGEVGHEEVEGRGFAGAGGYREEKTIRIMSCGGRAEVFIVMRPQVPLAPRTANGAERLEVVSSSADPRNSNANFEENPSAGALHGEGHNKNAFLDDHASTNVASPDETIDGPGPATMSICAISVRAGSYVGIASCAGSPKSQRRQVPVSESTSGVARGAGHDITCALGEWHALTLVVSKGSDAPVLCVDGDILSLQQDVNAAADAAFPTSEPRSDGVVLGGVGGVWATLAVKNLAVYNDALDGHALSGITSVYKAWREEQEAARTADAQDDENWLEEARKATEAGREPGKMMDGSDVHPSCGLVAKTLRRAYDRGNRNHVVAILAMLEFRLPYRQQTIGCPNQHSRSRP